MQRKYKQLLSTFVKLPYIIYRQKFLIPQSPYLVRSNTLIGHNNNIIGSFKSLTPEMVDIDLVNKANDPSQRESLVALYKHQVTKIQENHKKKVEQYNRMYIEKLVSPRKVLPAFLFFADNKDTITKQFKKQGLKWNFNNCLAYFQYQSQEIKEKYRQKSQEQYETQLERYNEAKALYLIPVVKVAMPKTLFKQDVEQGTVDDEKYSDLPPQTKKAYAKRYKHLKKESQEEFLSFLKARDLTPSDFTHIRTVCNEIAQMKKFIKNVKRNKNQQKARNKKSVKELLGIDEEIQMASQQPQQSIKEQIKEAKQEQPESQSEETDQNLDFSNSEINIFQLKKRSNLKGQSSLKDTPKH